MKKICLLFLSLTAMAFGGLERREFQIVSLEEFVQLKDIQAMKGMKTEEIENFMQSKWNPDVVLFLKKGIKVPVKLFLEGDYFIFSKDEEEMSVGKDLYIRMKKGEFLFSDDLQKWQSASNFFTGKFEVTVAEDSDNQGAFIKIGGEINKRK